MSAGNYTNTLDHPIDLADGKVVEAGEAVKLTAEQARDPHNKTLIADGALEVPSKTGDESKADEEVAK